MLTLTLAILFLLAYFKIVKLPIKELKKTKLPKWAVYNRTSKWYIVLLIKIGQTTLLSILVILKLLKLSFKTAVKVTK